jgi:uncharacterized protein YbjT (DUF2867 family)
MDVLVVGGHGQIAMRLLRLLAERGDAARGLIRDPGHAADLEQAGARPVLFDLEGEGDLTAAVRGADAVVFAAGAGPGSGAARKRTVDLGGATRLIDACRSAGVSRYLIISAMGVERRDYSEQMAPYYDAKREADEAVRASGLDHTIVRPGRLTDDPGSGRVEVGSPLDRRGEVSRDDVAAVLLAALDEPASAGLQFDLLAGETPIDAALASLIAR